MDRAVEYQDALQCKASWQYTPVLKLIGGTMARNLHEAGTMQRCILGLSLQTDNPEESYCAPTCWMKECSVWFHLE